MSQSVQMPALGESVTEGTVTRWLKAEGDTVEVDEPLLEVSTDKVDTEIPSPISGVLEKILVAEDETVAVGADLAIIGDGSGSAGGETSEGSDGDSADSAAEPAQTDDAAEQAEPEPEAAPAEQAAPAEAPSTESEAPAEKPTADVKPSGGSGTPVTLPAMGESVTEGTVTRWLKQVGDEVAVDEPLLEVSTDKVDTEVPSPVAGTLLEITVQEDDTVEVGGQLAIIGSAGAAPAEKSEPEPQPEPEPAPEPAPELKPEPAAAPAPPASAPTVDSGGAGSSYAGPAAEDETIQDVEPTAPPAPPAAPVASPAASPTQSLAPKDTGGSYVTPVIRKLAHDNDVDLSSITGTGVGGRIRREDVVKAAQAAKESAAAPAAAAPAAPAPAADAPAGSSVPKPDEAASALIGTTQKTPRIRQAIAKNMVAALQTAAQLTSVIEVDVTKVAALRARAKSGFEAREGVKLTFLPFFVKAGIEAAKAFPVVNSSLSEDLKELTYHGHVNMGIAVDTPRGLIVPVIKNADDLNLAGIARKIGDLAARTRNNKIGPDELSGGTFTVTNTGSVGTLFDTAIFTPPQSAILITGAIVKRPVVIKDVDGNDAIAIRSMAYLALSYDHRNVDGADAARFLQAVKKRIEGAEFEGDLGL
ncbi:2-oxoglutarate dehydrogenase, E2 component, dihydrolipoamide succinyltransferase [Nakamurella sp. A5-74]|uniref:Dihydrolipoamide acetyltransferase component of pyruvate dehydrogenase complex n=1 Tax=Nakamurella sp. A5-74 TaxID=3158264 RepID=A0AAU8DUM4_9ACTN